MTRRTVLLLTLAACARGRMDEPVVDGSPTAMPDAKITVDAKPDAPVSTGTCTQAFTGQLATWSFAGELGSQASTAVTTKANGISASAVSRAAALTAVSGAGSINSSGWPTAATRDATKYYAFTIAPPAGCTLSLTNVAIDARASGTGPVSASLSTSADNYVAAAAVSTTAAGLVAPSVVDASTMIELRIYGFAASAGTGTLRLQGTLSVDGQLK